MKHKLWFRIALSLIVILFSSYSAGEREEALVYSNKHLLFLQDKCFTNFLSELNSLGALVFIPEEKMSLAKKYEMNLISGDKAQKKNMNFTKESSTYVQITPSESTGSECQKSIALNFSNLEMAVFVKKENIRKAEEVLQIKYDKGSTLSSETIKYDARSAETLQIKVERSWNNYLPVDL